MSRRDALKVIALSGARTSFAVHTLGAATSFFFHNNVRAESIAPYSMVGDLSVFWGKPGPENAPIKLPSDARIVLQNAKAAIGRIPVLACCDIVFIPCRTVSPTGVVRLNQPLRLIGVNGGGRVAWARCTEESLAQARVTAHLALSMITRRGTPANHSRPPSGPRRTRRTGGGCAPASSRRPRCAGAGRRDE